MPMKNTAIWDAESGSSFFAYKRGLSAYRDVRDVLSQMALQMPPDPDKQAYFVIDNPKISTQGIIDEFESFREILRPAVALVLHIIITREGCIEYADTTDLSDADRKQVERHIATHDPADRVALPKASMKFEVFKCILLEWVENKAVMTNKQIADHAGCSYRTVAAVLELLGPAVARNQDRSFYLEYFPEDTLNHFMAAADKHRATIHYEDKSGEPVAAEVLMKRFAKLKPPHVALSGVIGAKHYNPDLDIVNAPRLDLIVHAPASAMADNSFIPHLDPALKESRTKYPAVAVHFLRRKHSNFNTDGNGLNWADPVECLLDLYEAGLGPQMSGFLSFIKISAERKANV